MSKEVRLTLTMIPLAIETLVSKESVDYNSEILNFAKQDMLRQVKKYVATMEIDDPALSWTIGEEEAYEQQVPTEEV